MVRAKKWRSEPCGLNVTISASCDWSVAIFTTSLESQESYLTLRNLTSQITRDFFRLHNTFARLYNAAASPASRLRSAGSLATRISTRKLVTDVSVKKKGSEMPRNLADEMQHSQELYDPKSRHAIACHASHPF